jgi:uncharacterized protein
MMPTPRWLAPTAALAVAGAALAVTLARPTAAATAPSTGTLTVTGQSTLSVPPNEAQITLGTQFNARTARRAMAKDSRVIDAVIAALEKAGVPKRDLETENYNLQPNENNPPGNEAPRVVSYTISDQIQITTYNLNDVGELIDVSVTAGANQVQGVNFTVSNQNALLDKANDSALAQAHSQAVSLAQAAGEQLGTLKSLNVSSQNSGPTPVFAAAASASLPKPTIVPPQSISISATVTAVYRLVS